MKKIHHIKAFSEKAENYYRTDDGFKGVLTVRISDITASSQAAWAACWNWMLGEVTGNGWTLNGSIDIDVKTDGAIETAATYDDDGDLVTPVVYRDHFKGSASVSKGDLRKQASFDSEAIPDTIRGYLLALNAGTESSLNT